MADNGNSKSKDLSNRKTKIPVPGLNPGALVFQQGRPAHIEPHANEKAINDPMNNTQNYWLDAFEAANGIPPPGPPYTNGPQDLAAWSPGYTAPSHAYLDPQAHHFYPQYLAPYFPNGDAGFTSSYGFRGDMDYVHPADPFAGQLYEVQDARHGGPVRGHNHYNGYGREAGDGYDGADERVGESKIGGKNKKKNKKGKKGKKKEGPKDGQAEGVAQGKRQEHGEKCGGD